ncbi:MAG: hypothetical protein WBC91_13760 [Phototrophicaceae bacterium]
MSKLKWHSVVIISNPLIPAPLQLPKPFTVTRSHLAQGADGILMAGWSVAEDQRDYPRAQLVGWKPELDVPFELPVKFYRKGDPRVSTLIPRGAWVLPYNAQRYWQYKKLAHKLTKLYRKIDQNVFDLRPDAKGRFYL